MAEDNQPDLVERRKHPRKPALWKARLRVGGEHFPCRILDLSLGGAEVRSDANLVPSTKLKLVIENIGVIRGIVAWVDGDRLGIKFTVDQNEVRFMLGSRGEHLGLE